MDVNSVILIGRVGKDPEIRVAAQGLPVVNFSLATNERFRNKTDELVERTEWHSLVAFGKLAEFVDSYVEKGSHLYIRGKLQNQSYEKEGTTVRVSQIVIQELSLLDKKSDNREKGKTDEVASSRLATEDVPF